MIDEKFPKEPIYPQSNFEIISNSETLLEMAMIEASRRYDMLSEIEQEYTDAKDFLYDIIEEIRRDAVDDYFEPKDDAECTY
jgi:hypothetical protein